MPQDLIEAQALYDISSDSPEAVQDVRDEPPSNPHIEPTEDESGQTAVQFLGADQFSRVVEFSDAECVLEPVSDEVIRIYEDVGISLPPARAAWFCRLDTDVNLRSLVQIAPSRYTMVWLFAYQMEPGFVPQQYGVQTYNCSMGMPLDAPMFISRTRDPTQPFISRNLNAIINPRVTVPLQVPRYDTSESADSSGNFMITRRNEGAVILATPNHLVVDWDGPTAFLIKAISSHFTRGSLIFVGVLLYENSESVLERGLPNAGRTMEVT